MNYNQDHNPLTEVALALSMAFFAIMILSIYALSHSKITNVSNNLPIVKLDGQGNNQSNLKRETLFFYNENFYDKKLKRSNFKKILTSNKKYLIAVPSSISVKKLYEIKDLFKNLDIKLTKQTEEWQNELKNKSIN
jgi:hypothetical protein|tara:strand:- start:4312 stop:4719 length:408 start_codon:yes stop_codon:yes gene_type:complete